MTLLDGKSSRSALLFVLQVSRPGFWLTTIWFYLLPTAQQDVFQSPAFWLGILYMTFPFGLLIYGANDIVDRKEDLFNPRKGTYLFGSRGTPGQLKALPLYIIAAQLPFLVAFSILVGPKILLWFVAVSLATAAYNCPPLAFKGRPPFDILNQAAYLLVFVLSSWLNELPQLPWPTFVFGALFAMHSHLFGEIMDIRPDREAGRKTTANSIGAIPSKVMMIVFLLAEAVIVAHYFQSGVLSGLLVGAALWFVLDAAFLWKSRPYSGAQMRCFFIGWNVVALGSMAWIWNTGVLTYLP